MVYSFRSGPSFRVASPAELFTSALDQPMSIGSTLLDQAKGGVLESFGLGTAIREFELPQEAPTEPGIVVTPEDSGAITVPDTAAMRRRQTIFQTPTGGGVAPAQQQETTDQLQQRRTAVKALNEDQYKASAYYRKEIPWDAGMTEDRAAVLASFYDAKKVREFYAEKRPIASFLGNLAGQALDPINYIPIVGPEVRAASLARFGALRSGAALGALDAAANTAAASLGTMDARRSFGDDVSWQTTISQIATAALIGGAFGTLGGAISERLGKTARADAEQRLSTLKTTQEARVALNEAIGGLARDGEISLSPNALEPIQRTAADIGTRQEQIDRLVQEQAPVGPTPLKPQTLLDFIAQEGGIKDEGGSISAMGLNRKFIPGRGALVRKNGKSLDYAREAAAQAGYFDHLYGSPERASELSTPDDLLRLMDAESRGEPAYSPQDSKRLADTQDHESAKAAQEAYRRILEEIDTARSEVGLDHQIDDNILTRASEFVAHEGDDPVTALERAMDEDYRKFADALDERGEGLSNEPEFTPFFEDSRTGSEPGSDAGASGRAGGPGDGQGNAANRQQLQDAGSAQRQALDASPARPDPIPDGLKKAESSVGKPDDYKAMAEQYRIDPETGGYFEEPEIKQIETEGRLTEDDKATLEEANQAYENGSAYGEALKAAVGCLI
jgi:hypothetical protein